MQNNLVSTCFEVGIVFPHDEKTTKYNHGKIRLFICSYGIILSVGMNTRHHAFEIRTHKHTFT